jgi:hypothetical protein
MTQLFLLSKTADSNDCVERLFIALARVLVYAQAGFIVPYNNDKRAYHEDASAT